MTTEQLTELIKQRIYTDVSGRWAHLGDVITLLKELVEEK